MNELMDIAKRVVGEYGVALSDIQKCWGIEYSLDQINSFTGNKLPYNEVFLESWKKYLDVNLESAIWLCVYNRMRLETTQREAMKKADVSLDAYKKEKKNAKI